MKRDQVGAFLGDLTRHRCCAFGGLSGQYVVIGGQDSGQELRQRLRRGKFLKVGAFKHVLRHDPHDAPFVASTGVGLAMRAARAIESKTAALRLT